MRTLLMFTLAAGASAALVTDASAFGKKNKGASMPVSYASPCGCSGGYGYSGYGMSGSGYGGMYGHPGMYGYSGMYDTGSPSAMVYGAGASNMTGVMNASGKQAVITTTEGKVYTLGADGSYYPADSGMATANYGMSNGMTLGGFTTQPGIYGASNLMYRYPAVPGGYQGGYNGGFGGYQGVYPAGYNGTPYGYSRYPNVFPAGGYGPVTLPRLMPNRR